MLEGDQVKFVDENASSLPDCPSLLTSLLGFDAPASWSDSLNVLVQLSVSMRAHGRGGLLLVVPGGTAAWRDSIVTPILYEQSPPFSGLSELMRQNIDNRQEHGWQEDLNRNVEMIAGLTAVDGATLLTDNYELLAFGAKIARRRGSPPVEQVTVTEPIEGGEASVVHPTELGGTRHLSAAQFVLRPAQRRRAGRIAGRPIHDLRVVAVRGHGPRPPRRNAVVMNQGQLPVASRSAICHPSSVICIHHPTC